jgi:hypothetical protein
MQQLQKFGEISHKIVAAAVNQGLAISVNEVDRLTKDEADSQLPHGSILFGTNARSNARRAKELLGWSPQYDDLEQEIVRSVKEEASKSVAKI